jgi:glutamine amidotransferase
MAEHVGMRAAISKDHRQIANAERLILPGVGHFGRAVEELRRHRHEASIRDAVLGLQRPLLGLCVGAQMLFAWGEEGDAEGLGFIPGRVHRFAATDPSLKLPHVGWRRVDVRRAHALVDICENNRFYFMHSYHAEPDDASCVIATARYGSDFPAIVSDGNICGVQFHPEKSHVFGKRLFTRFARLGPHSPSSA